MWTDVVAELLEEERHRQADTLRAAHAVVERLLGVVPSDTGRDGEVALVPAEFRQPGDESPRRVWRLRRTR